MVATVFGVLEVGRRCRAVGAALLTIAVLAVAAPAATTSAGAATAPFVDVPVDHRFATEITWLAEEGLAAGFPDGTFRPTDPVSRQAIAAMLHRLSGSPAATCDPVRFSDVPAEHEFCAEITWASDAGVALGDSGGTFRPAAPVSRQAIAAMLLRLTSVQPPACAPATVDADAAGDASHPFCAAITWAVLEGLTTGYADRTFHPTAPVSRQAIAAMLHRLLHGTCTVAVPTGLECTSTGVLVPPPRVAIYGDSAALGLGLGSGGYFNGVNPRLGWANGYTPLGCGITMGHGPCKTPEEWGAIATAQGTDIALIYSGVWEISCIEPSTEGWPHCLEIGDPVHDAYIRRELQERSAALLASGVDHVVYVKTAFGAGGGVTRLSDRWLAWHAMVDAHAATDPRVHVVDMTQWWYGNPARDLALRDDGYHFTSDTSSVFRDYFETRLYWYLWLPHVRAESGP